MSDKVGSRFEMKLYQLGLGNLDQKDAENEYVLRFYIKMLLQRDPHV